jgi:lysyl-tRNA synthetase class 2
MFLTNNPTIQEVLFFPQMKPEKKALAISDEAKDVLDLIIKVTRTELNSLKEQAGLSNKKWDKAVKEITKNTLAKVEKTDDGLFIEVV